MKMQVSDRCIAEMKTFESLRLQVYADPAGLATIGWGHLLTHDDIVTKRFDAGITEAAADVLFLRDLLPKEDAVNALNLELKQGQFDALTDFAYNCGVGSLKTMISHGLDQVPQELPKWVHAGHEVLPGLVTRRKVELAWWNE